MSNAAQSAGIVLVGRVGWVEKNNRTTLCETAQCGLSGAGQNLKAGLDLEGSEVCANRGDCGGSAIDEIDQACTPADRLDAHSSGAGIEISEHGALDAWGQDIK